MYSFRYINSERGIPERGKELKRLSTNLRYLIYKDLAFIPHLAPYKGLFIEEGYTIYPDDKTSPLWADIVCYYKDNKLIAWEPIVERDLIVSFMRNYGKKIRLSYLEQKDNYKLFLSAGK